MKFATSIILALAICGAHVQTRAEKYEKVPIPTFKPITYTDPKLVPFVFDFYSENGMNRFMPDASCTTKQSADASNAALEMLHNKNIQCDLGKIDTTRHYFVCYPWYEAITAQNFVDDFNTLNTDKEPCKLPKVPNIIEFAMKKDEPSKCKCWVKDDITSYDAVQFYLFNNNLSCEPHQQDNTLSCFPRNSSLSEVEFKKWIYTIIPREYQSSNKDGNKCVCN